MKVENIQCLLSVFTGGFALVDITNVLSIIILILSIANILWTMIYSIYKHVKSKDYDKIDDDIQNGINQIENLNNSNNKKEE